MPVPKKISSELFDELGDLLTKKEVSKADLDRIEFRAKGVRKSTPVEAYIVLGGVACMRNDIPAMHKHHKNAIRLAPSDFHAKFNYCVSLNKCSLHKEALACAEKAMSGGEYDKDLIDIAIEGATALGDDEKRERWIRQRKKLFGELDFEISRQCELAEIILSNCPEEIVPFNAELFQLAEELVEGVEVE